MCGITRETILPLLLLMISSQFFAFIYLPVFCISVMERSLEILWRHSLILFSTDYEISVSASALEAAVSESIPKTPWTRCKSVVPPTAPFPICSHKDACAGVQFGQATAFKEADD